MTRDIMRVLLFAACVAGSGCASGAVPPPGAGDSEYVFVPDTERLVEIWRGGYVLIGKLDANGDFLEDPSLRHKRNVLLSPRPVAELIDGNPGPAYEYRSGRLIKGEIREDGSFVPEAGSTVIQFTDYRYSPSAIPIWNLPGRFVKRGEEGKK
jgi:hypothetical protein